jgi:hypothetical protein
MLLKLIQKKKFFPKKLSVESTSSHTRNIRIQASQAFKYSTDPKLRSHNQEGGGESVLGVGALQQGPL